MRNGISQEWKRSVITPILKQKGDPLMCGNYRGIKLLSHCLKLLERMIEARLSLIVNIKQNQYGFQKGRSTAEPRFCLRILQEKFREFNRDLHMVFVDLEKAYKTIPWDLIWYCLRRRVCLKDTSGPSKICTRTVQPKSGQPVVTSKL